MSLAIVDVRPDPPLQLTTSGPAGVPMRATIFTGTCRIQKTKTKLFGGHGPVWLGFYVPGAGPFRPSHLLAAWAEMGLSQVEVVDRGGAGSRERYGVEGVQVQLVNDERGGGSLWPYLAFFAHGAGLIHLRYRMTVSQPDDAG